MNIKEEKEALDIESYINKSIEKARNLAKGLFHSDLEDTNLQVLLTNLKNDIESRYNLKCNFEIDNSIEINDIKILTQFYYIIQESVRNSVKHASAGNVFIKIYFENNFLCLKVWDDGVGIKFDKFNKGMGLNIMKYRARIIGGTFEVQNRKEKGTEIKCILKDFR